MHNYKEQLNFIKDNKIDMLSLEVAYEIDCVIEKIITDKQFELLCSKLEDCYLRSDNISLEELAYAINELLCYERKKISDILAMDKWTLIDKAINLSSR